MYFLFKMGMFQCHVSFQGCMSGKKELWYNLYIYIYNLFGNNLLINIREDDLYKLTVTGAEGDGDDSIRINPWSKNKLKCFWNTSAQLTTSWFFWWAVSFLFYFFNTFASSDICSSKCSYSAATWPPSSFFAMSFDHLAHSPEARDIFGPHTSDSIKSLGGDLQHGDGASGMVTWCVEKMVSLGHFLRWLRLAPSWFLRSNMEKFRSESADTSIYLDRIYFLDIL